MGKLRKVISILCVILLIFCLITPVNAMAIDEPKTITPEDALNIRVEQGFTHKYYDYDGIRNALGYQYNPQQKTWTVVTSDHHKHDVKNLNDVRRAHLLEYMYYVDKYGDANVQTIGAFGMVAGGIIGIMSTNPFGIAGGIAAISVAITIEEGAKNDKNLCAYYAHKIADQLYRGE